jgi:glutamine---fructose-6-phosphate transaminase (isomerizing)
MNADFGLTRDMKAVVSLVASFDVSRVPRLLVDRTQSAGSLTLVGEGSSRLVPHKQALRIAAARGYSLVLRSYGGCEAALYAKSLLKSAVLGVSNSGRTAEVCALFGSLRQQQHAALFALTAFHGSALELASDAAVTLACGKETAVAATKSVVEQALFCIAAVEAAVGDAQLSAQLPALSAALDSALSCDVDAELIKRLAASPLIYWAGFGDGIAEELALKTNEITRKPAHFLEGTYAVHGVEEVMRDNDVLVWIEPIEWQEQKFYDTLVKGAGVNVIAVATRQTRFPTIRISDCGDLTGLVALAAGWNLLVRVGTLLGVDVDKPQRARKVGNEIATPAS